MRLLGERALNQMVISNLPHKLKKDKVIYDLQK